MRRAYGITSPSTTVETPMTLVFTGRNVVLPGCDSPRPATIKVDTVTGKISHIQQGWLSPSDFPSDQDATWIDAGSNYILPGLVEWV